MLPGSARTSVVKTIIAVIFSPSVYRKQTLPSCPLPVAENRQTKQMSRDGRAVPEAAASLERGRAARVCEDEDGRGRGCEHPAHPPFSVFSVSPTTVRRGTKYGQGNLKTVKSIFKLLQPPVCRLGDVDKLVAEFLMGIRGAATWLLAWVCMCLWPR